MYAELARKTPGQGSKRVTKITKDPGKEGCSTWKPKRHIHKTLGLSGFMKMPHHSGSRVKCFSLGGTGRKRID